MMRSTRVLMAALILCVTAALPLSGQEPVQRFTMATGMNDGTSGADLVGTGGYMVGGFVSGLFLGLIGTGVTYAIAAGSNVEIPPQTQLTFAERPAEYVQGYQTSYTKRVRDKRKQSGLIGGLLGTATFLVIYLSASGS